MKVIQLEHPDAVTFPCPCCGERIPNFSVPINSGRDWNGVPRAPFHCPACRTVLCTSDAYRRWFDFWWVALAFIIPSVLRIGPWYFWLGAVVVSWVLLGFLASVYVKVLFPPKILRYDGPRIPEIPKDPNDLPINPWRKL